MPFVRVTIVSTVNSQCGNREWDCHQCVIRVDSRNVTAHQCDRRLLVATAHQCDRRLQVATSHQCDRRLLNATAHLYQCNVRYLSLRPCRRCPCGPERADTTSSGPQRGQRSACKAAGLRWGKSAGYATPPAPAGPGSWGDDRELRAGSGDCSTHPANTVEQRSKRVIKEKHKMLFEKHKCINFAIYSSAGLYTVNKWKCQVTFRQRLEQEETNETPREFACVIAHVWWHVNVGAQKEAAWASAITSTQPACSGQHELLTNYLTGKAISNSNANEATKEKNIIFLKQEENTFSGIFKCLRVYI